MFYVVSEKTQNIFFTFPFLYSLNFGLIFLKSYLRKWHHTSLHQHFIIATLIITDLFKLSVLTLLWEKYHNNHFFVFFLALSTQIMCLLKSLLADLQPKLISNLAGSTEKHVFKENGHLFSYCIQSVMHLKVNYHFAILINIFNTSIQFK